MSLNEEFTKDPEAFTAKYVVIVGDVTQMDVNKRVDLREFVFAADGPKYASLRYARKGETDVIKAYWLPWRKDEMVSMDLGSDANFFFTSQMTGCRFTVLTDDPKKPKVAHLAGTMSKTKRNAAEAEEKKKLGAEAAANNRRLSVSNVKEHGYSGLTGKAELDSSAFVYGVRDTGSGNWTFEAQIVDVAITESFNPKKTANVPNIKKPFKF